MATIPDDFQKRLQMFKQAGLEEQYGQYSGKEEQTRALKGAVRSTPEYQTSQLSKQIADLDKELDKRNRAYAEATSIVNDNPFYSEATRVGKQEKIDQKYGIDYSNLTNRRAVLASELESVNQAQRQARLDSRPQIITSTDAYGNTIITAIDPYTGQVINQTNAGGGRTPGANPVTSALSKVVGNQPQATQSTQPAKPTPGSPVPGIYQEGQESSDGLMVFRNGQWVWKQTGGTSTPGRPVQPQQPVAQQPQQPTVSPQTQSLLTRILMAPVKAAKDYGSYVLEAGNQAVQIGPAWFQENVLGRPLSFEQATRIANQPTTRFVDEGALANRGTIATQGVKRTAGAASYLVPGIGTGIRGAAIAGGISGGLMGVAEGENIAPESVVTGAGFGAAGGAILGPITSLVFQGIGKMFSGLSKNVSSKAAQSINRATPTQYANVVEQLGVDPNTLTRKYVPSGAGYDDLLGPVAQRGKGGILNAILKDAEKVIQETIKTSGTGKSAVRVSVDDFVKLLKQERTQLSKIPGNQANVKALDAFIAETKKLYKNGITAKKLLELKRAADSKFGAAVVDENVGSVAAQGQKMLANAARTKLKELFPEIAEALQTQSEVLTFRPIIEKARGTANTLGSEIRVGDVSKVNPLNPLSYGKAADAYLSDPQRASRFLNPSQVETGLGGEGVRTILGSRAGGLIGTQGSGVREPDQGAALPQTPMMQQPFTPQQTFSQPQAPQGPLASMGLTPEVLSQAMAVDQLETGGQGYTELKRLYDLAIEEQQSSTGNLDVASDLRAEYNRQTTANKFIDVTNSYGKMLNTPDTAAGDVSMVFAYMKMLDPGSVVREGEFATVENTAGIPEQVVNAYNKALRGRRLSAKQRAEFMEAAAQVYRQYQNTQQQIDAFYSGLAQQYRVDPSLLGIGTYTTPQIGGGQ